MSTKEKFAALVNDVAENEQLLAELEGLVSKAKKLGIEWRPVLQRYQQTLADTADDVLAESMVLAEVINEMRNLVARVEAAKAKRRG